MNKQGNLRCTSVSQELSPDRQYHYPPNLDRPAGLAKRSERTPGNRLSPVSQAQKPSSPVA
jgi:hypothetical protein